MDGWRTANFVKDFLRCMVVIIYCKQEFADFFQPVGCCYCFGLRFTQLGRNLHRYAKSFVHKEIITSMHRKKFLTNWGSAMFIGMVFCQTVVAKINQTYPTKPILSPNLFQQTNELRSPVKIFPTISVQFLFQEASNTYFLMKYMTVVWFSCKS